MVAGVSNVKSSQDVSHLRQVIYKSINTRQHYSRDWCFELLNGKRILLPLSVNTKSFVVASRVLQATRCINVVNLYAKLF